jgi:Cdc6-like AAA superfamily ATPase
MNIDAALKNLDSPIQSFEEDLLQRRGYVESLCRILETPSPEESTVFALYGEWGAGKTSVKNLLKNELAGQGDRAPMPIEFNPWAFSGQDQVLEAFFSEISKSIGRGPSGKAAAEGFKKLGAYLSFGAKTAKRIQVGMDLFGIPGAKIVGMVGEQFEGGSKGAKDYEEDINAVGTVSLEQVQKELRADLRKLERPLLVILDDLDRLTPDQLFLVFQIVKLNANLPRVNYLLLMDARTMADRLKGKQLGLEYLEKIVQIEVSLPHIPPTELKSILKRGFEAVMGKYAAQIDWPRWEDGWTNGCQNLFVTLRQIKRFLHTLRFHTGLFASDDVLEVDPVDLFLLEAIRKFAPNVHSEIPRVLRPIVCPDPVPFALWLLEHKDKKKDFGKVELDALVALVPEEFRPEIRRLLEKLFPQIGEGYDDEEQENERIRDARICHHVFFESYFRLAIPRQLPTQQEILGVFEQLESPTVANSALRAFYDKYGLHTLLVRIQCHRDRLKPEHIPPLLREIWALDDVSAQAAGVERGFDTRQATEAMSRFLLKNYCAKELRVKAALKAMHDSETLYPLARLVSRELDALKNEPQTASTAFDPAELTTLQPQVLNRIHEFRDAGKLLETPDAAVLLFIWAKFESLDAVRAWLETEVANATRAPVVLTRLIDRNEISGHQGTKVHFSISRKTLEHYLDVDALEKTLMSVSLASLPHWEKFAVEETLKRIHEKRRGIQEAEYPDFP